MRALALYVVAALVTVGWIAIVAVWLPASYVPRGLAGFLIMAVVYLAPGLLVGAYASNLPRARPMRCPSCRWRGKVSGR